MSAYDPKTEGQRYYDRAESERKRSMCRELLGTDDGAFVTHDATKIVLRHWGKIAESDDRFSVVRSDWVDYREPNLTSIVREYRDNDLPRYREMVRANNQAEAEDAERSKAKRKPKAAPVDDAKAKYDYQRAAATATPAPALVPKPAPLAPTPMPKPALPPIDDGHDDDQVAAPFVAVNPKTRDDDEGLPW